jgi:alpha-L-fucosidase
MRKLVLFKIAFLFVTDMAYGQSNKVLPTKSQIKWAESEIGVLIHFDINIYAPETFDYSKKETLPPSSVFNPSKLNTDQWILAAKKAGAKYAILTAKHGTGFALWPTKINDYHIGNTPVKNGKGDIVRDFIKSCKKYGLKPGIYYNTNMNTYYGAGYTVLSEQQRLEFNQVVYKQLSELWNNYGKLFEIWFDGGVMSDNKIGIADKVIDLLKRHQPNAVLFGGPTSCKNVLRWVGNEDGRAPYPHWSRIGVQTVTDGLINIPNLNGDLNGKFWMPAEADFPNHKKSAWNGGWLWREGQDSLLFSADDLIDRYYTSVGRNANMLIGMAIDTSGLFPIHDSQIFETFGNMLKQREKSKIASTKGKSKLLTITFNKPSDINQIEIQEDIAKGERIRAYKVEGLVDGNWLSICDGISVGHKRIQLFDKVKVSSVRLVVTEASETPLIKNFAVYMF